jgi:hypothetical protein
MRKSQHVTEIWNHRWKYRDIKEYLTADKQNLTCDSIQRAGVVGIEILLREIVHISLLYHLPDVTFCFTL